jgi:magnesium transporter
MSHHRRRRIHFPTIRPGVSPGTFTGDPDAALPPVQILAYGPDAYEELEGFDAGKIAELRKRFPVVWVNVDGVRHAATVEHIGEAFGVHRLALEDVVNVPQRPKADEYGDILYLVARVPCPAPDRITEQISVFLGQGWVLTFQETPGDFLEGVRARIRDNRPRLRGAQADYLTYAILDSAVDSFFPLLETFAERVDAMEDHILERAGTHVIEELHAIKRELVTLRRQLWPLREAMAQVARDENLPIEAETRPFLRDVQDHATQALELTESMRDLASGLMDLYLSFVSHRMNEVMKVLTIIATIFIPLSFIAGVYGMNFDTSSPWNMPELAWRGGYPFALGLMAASAGGLLLWFRRMGWFR